jgi:DNA processing protein
VDATFERWLGLPEEDRSETDCWLVLARLHGPSGLIADAAEHFGSAQGVLQASAREMTELLGVRETTLRRLVAIEARIDLSRERDAFARAGATLLTTLSPDYPRRLRDLPDRPACLFVQGKLAELARDSVAIVGSRSASEAALADAETLAARIAAVGYGVVSGFAVGVDAAAHTGALRHGSTVAALGCGIDVDYPKAHGKLRERVVESGALVSELPMGEQPRPYTFPRRNRLIAALSLATVVVGAGERSGALLTVEAAVRLRRPVGAVPADTRDPRHRGVLSLLTRGVPLIESADDVLALLGREGAAAAPAPPGRAKPPTLSPDESAVLQALDHEPLSTDAIAERSGVGAVRASTALLLLEVKGCVRRHSGGRYSLALPE